MTRRPKTHKARKTAKRIQRGYPETLRRVLAAVHDVRTHRQMNAAESPASQDAWDRLRIAVLEAEQRLYPVKKT